MNLIEQAIALRNAIREALETTVFIDPSANAGNLATVAAPWEADKAYPQGAVFSYDGKVGFTRQAFTSSAVYPPFSTGTESLYGIRPPQDSDGVYDYIYNMRAEVGMKVRENGVIYVCIQAVDPLLFPPSQVPAHFEVEV